MEPRPTARPVAANVSAATANMKNRTVNPRHMARSFVRGEGIAEANGAIKVGAKLALTGLGPLFDGTYRTTAVHHSFDQAAGLRTEFRCERPGIGRPT